MTRKEKVNKMANEISSKIGQECFFWNCGKFAYWDVCEIIENNLNEEKFYFCTSNGTSLFSAFKKYDSGNFEMSSQKFAKKIKEFEEWLANQTEKNLKILSNLKNLAIAE